MSLQNGLNSEVRPMDVFGSARSTSVLTGATDFGLAQSTEGLWYQSSGTWKSWTWPDPDTAPSIRTATVGSNISFSLGDATAETDFMLPWFSQLGVTRVRLTMDVAVRAEQGTQLHLGFDTQTLVTSVATATSVGNELRVYRGPPRGPWTGGNARWNVGQVSAYVDPTYPADRRVAIVPFCKWLLEGPDPVNISMLREAKILSIFAEDVMPEPDDYA